MAYTYLTESSPKTQKGEAAGYLTAILYLAPSDLSGKNVCPNATPECVALCLNTAGRAGIMKSGETSNAIQRARIARTNAFFADRCAFIETLSRDIYYLQRRAAKLGLKPAVRLNGTSDLRFDRFTTTSGETLMTRHSDVQFYDYTKSHGKAIEFAAGKLPANYHVTFSRSENTSRVDLQEMLSLGINVAVPFVGDMRLLPAALQLSVDPAFHSFVVDGDETDLRFLDPQSKGGRIVALTAKGKAKRTVGGFVVDCR
jgi:hypothetical protein